MLFPPPERCEDAGDHQIHSPIPAEVLHGEPGEPGSTAQELEPFPQSWGISVLCLCLVPDVPAGCSVGLEQH